MAVFKKIAVINTGWSDDYRGGEVRGNFDYLTYGVGHEKYNFLPAAGRFYAYTPPLGEQHSPPMPADADDWLVFAVSKRPGKPGLYLVGWYEKARFVRGYANRPDAVELGEDSDGGRFTYTLSAGQAYAIPLPLRDRRIRGDHIKRSYAYLRGNGLTDPWRAAVARQLLGYRTEFLTRLQNEEQPEEKPRIGFCGSAARRKEIEDKAVAAVARMHSDWDCVSKEAEKCGYDLLLTHRVTGDVRHVEVKGTALDQPHFFITARERAYAEKLAMNDKKARTNAKGEVRPIWRLAMVRDVDRAARVEIYSFAEMERAFELSPLAYHAVLKPDRGGAE